MSSLLARPGDTFESATSDNPQARVHATLRQDGQVGLLLINESATSSQSVHVTVNGPALTNTATQYQFGASNFAGNNPLPRSHVKTNTVTGVGNLFTINVPIFTMTELLIPCGPAVFYTANPTNGTVPLTVQFTAPNVDSGGNPVTHWNWAFGDGTTSTAQNPLHTYTTAGAFSTSLIATNTNGATVLGIGPPITVSPGFGLVQNGGFATGDFTQWTQSGNTRLYLCEQWFPIWNYALPGRRCRGIGPPVRSAIFLKRSPPLRERAICSRFGWTVLMA